MKQYRKNSETNTRNRASTEAKAGDQENRKVWLTLLTPNWPVNGRALCTTCDVINFNVTGLSGLIGRW